MVARKEEDKKGELFQDYAHTSGPSPYCFPTTLAQIVKSHREGRANIKTDVGVDTCLPLEHSFHVLFLLPFFCSERALKTLLPALDSQSPKFQNHLSFLPHRKIPISFMQISISCLERSFMLKNKWFIICLIRVNL